MVVWLQLLTKDKVVTVVVTLLCLGENPAICHFVSVLCVCEQVEDYVTEWWWGISSSPEDESHCSVTKTGPQDVKSASQPNFCHFFASFSVSMQVSQSEALQLWRLSELLLFRAHCQGPQTQLPHGGVLHTGEDVTHNLQLTVVDSHYLSSTHSHTPLNHLMKAPHPHFQASVTSYPILMSNKPLSLPAPEY